MRKVDREREREEGNRERERENSEKGVRPRGKELERKKKA